jgi:hypothetical protein
MVGLLGAVSMVVGCSSGDGGGQRSEDEVRDPPGHAVQVVQNYIDALRSGDVDAALQYRCSTAGDLPVELASEQIDRLSGLTGEVEAVEARESITPT